MPIKYLVSDTMNVEFIELGGDVDKIRHGSVYVQGFPSILLTL